MANVFDVPARPLVPIVGSDDTFPVRRVFCIGRNYGAHAVEMGLSADRETPFYFTKFADDVIPGGGRLPYPSGTSNYQYECELVVAIGREGANVAERDALGLVYGYAVGLDMTRRDLQLEARAKQQPWDIGKNFAFSAPIGPISRMEDVGHIGAGSIRLTVNGEVKQDSDVNLLLWNCPELIAFLSRFDRLLPGDLIYTGTPAGVSPVAPGDILVASVAGLESLTVTIGELDAEYRQPSA
jgi:fumarylpyruvate hydrolase